MAAAKKPASFDVVQVPINTLKPAEYNPRKASEKEVADVRASLTEFGFVDPIIANSNPKRKNIVIGGHLRLRVALLMGMTSVPVHYVSLDEKRERELNLRLNRNTGSWDWDALAEFDPALLVTAGFTMEELAFNFDLDATEDVVEDEPPPPPENPTSRTGDLWLLGEHRVLCGDSTRTQDVVRLMNGSLADFMFTSPPYNVGVAYSDHDDATAGWEPYGAFLRAAVDAWLPALARGRMIGWNIVSSPKTFPHRQMVMMEDAGLTYVRNIVWNKVGVPFPLWHITRTNPVARNFHPNYTHEFVLLFSTGDIEKGATITLDDLCEHDVFKLHQTAATRDLADNPSATRTGAHGGGDGLNTRARKAHPAAYPVRLPAMFASCLSDVGAVIVDPFLGSGSTLMAAENIGRACFGMEMAPQYVDVIVNRWQNATEKVATLDGGGTFAEVAVERGHKKSRAS